MNAPGLSRLFFSVALFAAGCAIGYFAGLDGYRLDDRSKRGDSAQTVGHSAPGEVSDESGSSRSSRREGDRAFVSTPRGSLRGEALISRFAECLLERSDDDRHSTWLALLKRLTPEDAPAVRDLFRHVPSTGLSVTDHQGNPVWACGIEWSAFWRRWGQIDGSGAMDYLDRTEDGFPIAELAQMVMCGWAQKSPDAARRWLEDTEHQGRDAYFEALTGFIDGRARSDYVAATRFAIETVKREHENAWQIASVLADQAILQGGVQGLTSWFDQIPNDAHGAFLKGLAASAVVSRLQNEAPARAMEWISQHAEPAWRDDDAIGTTAERVATQIDPATALNWLITLPPSTESGSYPGMNRVIRQFAAKDSTALEAWLREPKPQEIQDQALAAYASLLKGSNPAAADQWLAQIQDPRRRESTESLDFVVGGSLQPSMFRVIRRSAGSAEKVTLSVESVPDRQGPPP